MTGTAQCLCSRRTDVLPAGARSDIIYQVFFQWGAITAAIMLQMMLQHGCYAAAAPHQHGFIKHADGSSPSCGTAANGRFATCGGHTVIWSMVFAVIRDNTCPGLI
jgi:hypothetical protein